MSNGSDTAAARCQRRLEVVLGLSAAAAKRLVADYSAAAGEQMLEQMAAAGPVPSSLLAHRAELMHRTSLRAERILSVREIAVLLRVTDASAGAVRREMLATYEVLLQDLLLADALVDSRWTTYIDGAGHRGAKLVVSSPSAATTVEYQLRRLQGWKGLERDGRAILFPPAFDGWIDPVRPPEDLL